MGAFQWAIDHGTITSLTVKSQQPPRWSREEEEEKEKKKVLWLVLWRDCSYSPRLNSLIVGVLKARCSLSHTGLRKSREGKHAEYAAPEPTET